MANHDDETNDESDDTDISLSISPIENWSFHQPLSPIDNFSNYFYENYDSSPIFSVDSLEDTIISAMESTPISDRSPLLIYLHHQRSLHINIFCARIFCDEKMIEYLINNYIVWPLDLTSNSSREKFNEIWQKIFLDLFQFSSTINQYPLIIGVKHRQLQLSSPKKSKYEYEILTAGDQNSDSLESIIAKLRVFKRKFLENEKYAPTTFFNEIPFPKKILKKVLSYLTVQEIIMSFSPSIIPWLQEERIPLEIVFPLSDNENDILQYLPAENLKSLRLMVDRLSGNGDYQRLESFSNIQSITVINADNHHFYMNIPRMFLRILSWTFCYDSNYSLIYLIHLIASSAISPRRLTIRCAEISCSHPFFGLRLPTNDWRQLENFTLEVNICPLTHEKNCHATQSSCFLHCLYHCLKKCMNLRSLHLKISIQDVQNLLFEIDVWHQFLIDCSQLREILIFVKETILEEWFQIVHEVQSNLSMVRDGLIFQIKSNPSY